MYDTSEFQKLPIFHFIFYIIPTSRIFAPALWYIHKCIKTSWAESSIYFIVRCYLLNTFLYDNNTCGYFIHHQHSAHGNKKRPLDVTSSCILRAAILVVVLPLKIATNVFQTDRTFNILIIVTHEQRHRDDNIAASNTPYLSVARLARVWTERSWHR